MLKEAVGLVQIIASASHGVQYGGKTFSETKELLDQMTERASREILSALSGTERRDIRNRTQIVAQVMALVGFPDRECRNPHDQMIIIEACQTYSDRLPAMLSSKSKDHSTIEPRTQATGPEFAIRVPHSESSKQDEQSAGSGASATDCMSSDESSAHADDDDEDYEQEEESEDDELDQDEDY